MSATRRLTLSAAVVLLLVVSAHARTWTDATGKYTTEATLVECQGGIAYLKKDTGGIVPVPVTRLSQADQDFIKTTVAAVNVITGKVVGVTDGDTLTVLDEAKTQYKIRLEGIDCPESGQAHGTQARKALGDKVFQKDIRVEWREKDKYGRTLGDVFLDGRWINKELVEEGWAWHYKEYSKSEVLAEAENKARAATAGLWQDKNAMPPWHFRHAPVATTPVSSPEVTPPSEATDQREETVYVTRTGEKYHREGCRYLRSSKIPMPLDQAAARYSPCSVCNPPEPDGRRAETEAPPATEQQEETVYVTKTGAKYHGAGCRYLSKSSIPMPVSQAAVRYSPCSVCNPTRPNDKGASNDPPASYSPPSSSGSSGGTVSVRGYYRKDGTYVRPHTRSKPKR